MAVKRKPKTRKKEKPRKPPRRRAPLKCPEGCGPHPEPDASVFINPDGSSAWTSTTNNCPRVIMVWSNEHRTVQNENCNPNFNYQPLINAARNRISQFIQGYNCPGGCPFKEFYPTPGVGEHVETTCAKLGNGAIYTAHIRSYFVCTDFQV